MAPPGGEMMLLIARLITPEILAALHHFSMASTYEVPEISLPELHLYGVFVCGNDTFTTLHH